MRTVLAIAATMLLTACGAASGQPAGSRTATPGAGSSPSPAAGLPASTTPANGSGTLVVTEPDNGHVLPLRVGHRLELMLASTYWQVDGSSDPNVLRQVGLPAVSPQPTGCVPGQGCGTVIAVFDAVTAGRADVTASRTSCGEALSCTGSLGFYRVTIVVSA